MGNENSKKSNDDKLFDAAFEMKSMAKQLEKESGKIRQNEQRERAKVAAVIVTYLSISGIEKRKC